MGIRSPGWRQSSYTATDNCVEIADTIDAVRDSKRPNGPVLTFPREQLEAFFDAVRSGSLDCR